MKNLLIITFLVINIMLSTAQTFERSIVTKSAHKEKLKAQMMKPKLNMALANTSPSPVNFTDFALQFNFTQISRTEDNKWKIGSSFAVGYAFLFNWARGSWHPDSSITIESRWAVGGGANFGLIPDENGVLIGSVPIGAILAYSAFGIFAGWDVLNNEPAMGVTYHFTGFPLTKSLTRFQKLPN